MANRTRHSNHFRDLEEGPLSGRGAGGGAVPFPLAQLSHLMADLSETLMPARGGPNLDPAPRQRSTVFKRWASLACAIIFVEFAAGCAYAYGIYSASLGKIFGWTDANLASISSLADIGLYISLDGGFVFDRWGPILTLLVGAVQCSLGYVLVYLMSAGVIAGSVSATTGFLFIAFHGASWLDTVGVATTLRNFPQNGALVVGLVKAFFGLSGSIISTVYLTFFIARSNTNNSSSPEEPQCYTNGSHYPSSPASSSYSYSHSHSSAGFHMPFAAFPAALSNDGGSDNKNHDLPASGATAMPVFLFLAGASFAGPVISSIFTRLVSTGTLDAATGLAQDPPPLRARHMTKLYAGYAVVATLALVMAGTVVYVRAWAVSAEPAEHTYVYIVFSAVMGLLVALGVVVAVPCGRGGDASDAAASGGGGGERQSYHKVVTGHVSDEDDDDAAAAGRSGAPVADEQQLLQPNTNTGHDGGGGGADGAAAAAAPVSMACMAERTLFQSLLSPEYWLLWFVHFFGTGAGLMIINQIAQIALSYGDTSSSAAIFVTIVGVRELLLRSVPATLS